MTATAWLAIAAGAAAIIRAAVSVGTFLRDRPNLKAKVYWDQAPKEDPPPDFAPNRFSPTTAAAHFRQAIPGRDRWRLCLLEVVNSGRRPILALGVCLELPKGYSFSLEPGAGTGKWSFDVGATGVRIEDGAGPVVFQREQNLSLVETAWQWRRIRARLVDSTGKVWKLRLDSKRSEPLWVVEVKLRLDNLMVDRTVRFIDSHPKTKRLLRKVVARFPSILGLPAPGTRESLRKPDEGPAGRRPRRGKRRPTR